MKKWRKNNIPDPNVLATENVSHKRRGVTRGARGRDSPGAEWLPGAPKGHNNVTSTFFNSTFASERPQVRTWGAKLASCPGRHPSSLRSYTNATLITRTFQAILLQTSDVEAYASLHYQVLQHASPSKCRNRRHSICYHVHIAFATICTSNISSEDFGSHVSGEHLTWPNLVAHGKKGHLTFQMANLRTKPKHTFS